MNTDTDTKKQYDNQKRYQVYKGNSKGSGAAASFTFNTDTKDVYLEIVKQTSWNESSKTASFKDGDKKILKLGVSEVGQILEVINSNGVRTYSTVHKNTYDENKTTSIKFNGYGEGLSAGNPSGYAFSTSAGESKFSISFTIGEAEVIRLFLSAAVVASFGFSGVSDTSKKTVAPKPKVAASEEVDGDEF